MYVLFCCYCCQISTFTGDLGASLVQLNCKDCLWKLGGDLLHLFVYRPTSDLSHHISSLETLYQECYSKKLITSVYSAKNIQQVLRAKELKCIIQVESVCGGAVLGVGQVCRGERNVERGNGVNSLSG